MKNRCGNENYIEYEFYGGRGISVCSEWSSFDVFLRDMGQRPNGKTLDRIDTNADYCPENCRWATPKEQARNTRRNVIVSISGQSKTVAEWCEHPNAAKDKTIYRRLKLGWQGHEAVFGKTK